MNVYQVTLNSGRTDTIKLSADSIIDIQSIYNTLSDAKITSIKKVVYVNPSPSIDFSTPFYREMKVLLGNGSVNRFLVVRFVKSLMDKERLISLIKSYLTLEGKKINSVHNLVIWR